MNHNTAVKNFLDTLFPTVIDNIVKDICPLCGQPIVEFRDDLSREEHKISGLCQKCQDGIFRNEGVI